MLKEIPDYTLIFIIQEEFNESHVFGMDFPVDHILQISSLQ